MLATSTFLQGSFAPVTDEVTAFDLPVTGHPGRADGRYLRNGPNPLGLDDPGYHWFIGAGMVHGVRLRDGRAEWYRNRWVRSRRVAEAARRDLARRARPRRSTSRPTPTHQARGTDPGHRRGRRAAVRAGPPNWAPGALRLRRNPARRFRRAHQGRPAHRGTARHRLLLGPGLLQHIVVSPTAT